MTRISACLAQTGEAPSLAVQPALEKANPPRNKAGKANKAQPKLKPAANGKGEELVEEKSEKGKIVKGKKLDPQYSVQYEARSIGSLKCERLANLIGCCCDGEERLVVTVSMPNDTLANNLILC